MAGGQITLMLALRFVGALLTAILREPSSRLGRSRRSFVTTPASTLPKEG